MREFERVIILSDLHIAPEGWCNGEFKRIESLADWMKYKINLGYKIILNGDIFEFWEGGYDGSWNDWQETWDLLKEDYPVFIDLLLNNPNVYYIIGNHDQPIKKFTDNWTNHLDFKFNKKTFNVSHGHLLDMWNSGDMSWVGRTISYCVGWLERLGFVDIDKSLGEVEEFFTNPKYIERVKYGANKKKHMYDVIVAGHTHKPEISDAYINTGYSISKNHICATIFDISKIDQTNIKF